MTKTQTVCDVCGDVIPEGSTVYVVSVAGRKVPEVAKLQTSEERCAKCMAQPLSDLKKWTDDRVK